MISQEQSEVESQFRDEMSVRRLPSLVALRCFEAAARLESFSRAADELHLTHGAISRAVRAVEDELGVPLFERRSRRVYLSDHGRMLFDGVHAGLARMAEAVAAVRRHVAQRPLLLSCEPTLLMRWLIPRWGDFQARHPQCIVHLVAGGGPVNWGTGLDLAIRRNDFDWGHNIHAVPLCAEHMGPVCQPGKLALFFEEENAGCHRLRAEASLLHSKTRPHAWSDWLKQQQMHIPPAAAASSLILEHFYLSLQAATAGLGVAMSPQLLAQDDVRAGRLAAPLGFAANGSQYCLLAPQAWAKGSAAQLLCDWLLGQMEGTG